VRRSGGARWLGQDCTPHWPMALPAVYSIEAPLEPSAPDLVNIAVCETRGTARGAETDLIGEWRVPMQRRLLVALLVSWPIAGLACGSDSDCKQRKYLPEGIGLRLRYRP
jgi:hypothetical protein